ncbi:MAG: flagellar basal body-associated FliL family protein [Deltaproteobacteria bacterium]|nr:flagellar basal body-associated FliL family protein [Deltaproteobacteria bacterium]
MAEAAKKSEESQGESDEKKKKGIPIKLIIVTVLALFMLAGIFVVVKKGILPKLFGKDTLKTLSVNTGLADIGPIYGLETFIVNLLGSTGKNYLKATIDLEIDNIKTKEEIDKRLPQFRDSILTLLSSKTHDDVKTLEGKFQLRTEITAMLNQYLKTGRIINVYFTDFIVQ